MSEEVKEQEVGIEEAEQTIAVLICTVIRV